MTQANFQPIFDYIDQLEVKLRDFVREVVSEEVRPLKTAVANLAGEMKAMRQEMAVANHRVKRLENWATPVGKKVDIPFES